MPEKTLCRVEDCKRRPRTDGLCAKHQWEIAEGLMTLVGDARSTQCSIQGCNNPRGTAGLCTMHYNRRLRGAVNWDDPQPWRNPAQPKTCKVQGCERTHAARGLCQMHYSRQRRGVADWADVEPRKPGRRPSTSRSCLVEECGRPVGGHGLCATHLARKRKGEPNWDDPIPRTRPARPQKQPKPGPVPPEIAAKLKADYEIARRVNGATPENSTDREVNRRFNARIADLIAAGHTHAQIAEAAGASKHMVNRRLTKMRSATGSRGQQNEAQPIETCANGHPRTAANLTTCSDGKVRCQACRREAQRRRTKRIRSNPELQPEIAEDMHGGATAYRCGCRCAECRRFHAKESQQYKWMLRFGPGAPMGPEVRERILEALRRTGSVMDAAAEIGVKHQAIYGAARAVPGFGILVDELTARTSSHADSSAVGQ